VREAAAAWKDWLGEVRENGAGVLERTAMRIEDVTSSVRDLAAESIATAEATRVANENMIAFATTLGEDVLAQLSAAGDMVSEFADKGEAKLSMFAETMADQLGGALRGSLDLLVEWASGADVSLSAFASSVAASMARAMAAMLAFEAIKATIGVSSGSFGAALASSLGFGGFAAGGSFTVPNSGGGTDSVPVAFRATPGERVTISPPGSGGGAERAAQAQPVNVNAYLVHDAHEASIAALNTPAGQRSIIAAIAANPGAVRAAVGR
jgi:hypothetical protein